MSKDVLLSVIGVIGYLLLAAGVIWLLWGRHKLSPTGYCRLCKSPIFTSYTEHFDVYHRDWQEVREA